jgi:hypothetical protein
MSSDRYAFVQQGTVYVAASYMTYKALPLTDLMKGFVTQPLGTCAERDAKIRAAWIGR